MVRFQELIKYLEQQYYANVFMAFFELTAIFAGLAFVQKNKTGILFLIYLFIDFSVLLSFHFVILFTSFRASELAVPVVVTNMIISIIELLTYYHFFFKIIKNKWAIKIMKLCRIAFIGLTIIFIASAFSFLTDRYWYVSDMISITEFLFLLLPCLIYFYELFERDPVTNLYQRPSFWIVTGIFFYSLISIPYLLIERFVDINNFEYVEVLDLALYYIPFTINFIFLTRAFSCKKPLTI